MSKLFQYDDGEPIGFALTPHSIMVAETIQNLGGKITSVLDAKFEVYTARSPYIQPNVTSPERVTMVDAAWIEECMSAKSLTPIYPHILSKSSEPLQTLQSDDRDIGELIKAIHKCGGVKKLAYKTLHKKYPHNTSQEWGGLHEKYQGRITKSLKLIEIRMKNRLDATLRRLLSEAPSVLSMETTGIDEDNMSDVTLTSSMRVPHVPLLQVPSLYFMRQNIRSSAPISRRKSSGTPITGEDIQSMVSFLVQRKLAGPRVGEMTLKDWKEFKEKYDAQGVRSIDGWRAALRARHDEVMKLVNKQCRKTHSV